jgi:hypothetical protein
MAEPTLTSPPSAPPADAWKTTGVRVIPGDSLDANTAQTPGKLFPLCVIYISSLHFPIFMFQLNSQYQ